MINAIHKYGPLLTAGLGETCMRQYIAIVVLRLLIGLGSDDAASGPRTDLARGFANPPDSAKAWCYWWWLNGAASKEGITRDFEEMKKQGISGALLFDAGEAGPDAPRGPAVHEPARGASSSSTPCARRTGWASR